MEVHYCDLCGVPCKEKTTYHLYVLPPSVSAENSEQGTYFNNLISSIAESTKEICPECKRIFDRIFDLRKERLGELTEELQMTFDLPTKKEDKKKKDKK